jgi:signal recognition particle subunit SEC65
MERPIPDRHRKVWTPEEDDRLTMLWGLLTLAKISAKLERTPWSVSCRARHLDLGSPARSTWSVRSIAKYSGFSAEKIENAIKKLGISVHRAKTGNPRGPKARWARAALDDEQVDGLIQYMLEHPYVWTDAPGMSRSTKGAWGVGKKPAQCVKCGRNDRPHMARGECRACYMGKFRRAAPPSPNKTGRAAFSNPVLTAEKVVQIRERRHAGETFDSLAAEFRVTRQAISQIVKGMTWKHAGGPIAPYTYANVERHDLLDER